MTIENDAVLNIASYVLTIRRKNGTLNGKSVFIPFLSLSASE